jgi:hypothetical protein
MYCIANKFLSVVENNVAIVVSSMPGYAAFFKLYVAKSHLIKSIKAWAAQVAHGDASTTEANSGFGNGALDQSSQQQQNGWVKLNDFSLSQYEANGHGDTLTDPIGDPSSILRTVEIEQRSDARSMV